MSARILAAVAFAAIAIFGNYSILGLPQRNGWAVMFADEADQKEALLASIGQTSKTNFTGIGGLDFFLDQVIYFSIRCINGERKAFSLFATYFTGQVTSTHAAIVLEGLRTGNIHKIISYSTFWGMLYQAIPQGIILPIFCAVYLWKSPLATGAASLKPLAKAESLSINPIQASAVTGAMVLGFIMPTLLISLPSPELISTKQQQAFLAIWQFWPIYVTLWQYILSFFARIFGLGPEQTSRDPVSRLKYIRGVYRNILIITSVLHFIPIAYMFSPWVRSAFSGIAEVGPIDLKTVFVPMSAFSPRQVESVAEGCQILLQYDMYCAFGAMLLWIIYLSYARAGYSTFAAVKTVFKYLVRILLVGPGGAIFWALWDRDEDALSALLDKQKI